MRNGTYLIGSKQKFNKKWIVVNNNIKTQSNGQYEYEDGSPVPANELIHIMNNGTSMTGGVHGKDSVNIYAPKKRKGISRRQISQIRRATTTTAYSGGGSSGGGY